MINSTLLSEITDKAVKSVSQRLAAIEMQGPCEARPLKGADMLSILAYGDYQLNIRMYAEHGVIASITRNMLHADEMDEDTKTVYLSEYFNILCGGIVSSYNRAMRASARFGIPQVNALPPPSKGCSVVSELCYQCDSGIIKLEFLDCSTTAHS